MARCPYLDWEGGYTDYYICKLTGKRMTEDDTRVKYTCKPDYGEEYRKCQVYQDKA